MPRIQTRFFIVLLMLSMMITLSFPLLNSRANVKTLEVSVGDKAPDFTLIDLNNYQKFSLSDYKGKVVMLDLFATWCGPCIAAMPYIRGLAYSYYDLIVISIDIDSNEGESLVKEFKDEHSMSWKVALDDNGIVDNNYGTGYIPSMYIINQTGYIEYKEIGFYYDQVVAVLTSLLVIDSIKPQIINPQIDPLFTPLSFIKNDVQISCDNVSDDLALKSIFAQVSSPGDEVRQYSLSPNSNGSINQIIKIDPKQLYQRSTLQITLIAIDYKGNKVESSTTNIDILETESDSEKPTIVSIETNYELIYDQYIYTVKTHVTDDLFVYRITILLREGNKPQTYEIQEMKRNQNEENLFEGTRAIKKSEITNPENVWATIMVEDIAGNKVDSDETIAETTPWFGEMFLLYMLALAFSMIILRRKE